MRLHPRRGWALWLGLVLLAVGIVCALARFGVAWEVGLGRGLVESRRAEVRHGRLVFESNLLAAATRPPGSVLVLDFDPGLSLAYEQTLIAPYARARRIPVSVFLLVAGAGLVWFAFHRRRQPAGHCVECGYRLADLSVCPECGRAADRPTARSGL